MSTLLLKAFYGDLFCFYHNGYYWCSILFLFLLQICFALFFSEFDIYPARIGILYFKYNDKQDKRSIAGPYRLRWSKLIKISSGSLSEGLLVQAWISKQNHFCEHVYTSQEEFPREVSVRKLWTAPFIWVWKMKQFSVLLYFQYAFWDGGWQEDCQKQDLQTDSLFTNTS